MKLSFVFTLLGTTCFLSGCTSSATVEAPVSGASDFLKETEFLNYSHPTIQAALQPVLREHQTPQARAVALHDLVRDQVVFGFDPKFYRMNAAEVLESGTGYCNTKSTLFIALLRGAGIPARHRFYGLSSSVLDGVLSPGTRYVDHSIIEVYLNERWIRTDSYIVDAPYFSKVQSTLTSPLGLGIRKDGSTEWDGSQVTVVMIRLKDHLA